MFCTIVETFCRLSEGDLVIADAHVANESGLNDVPTEILHIILLYLLQKPTEETGISNENLTTFLNAIRRGMDLVRCNGVYVFSRIINHSTHDRQHVLYQNI